AKDQLDLSDINQQEAETKALEEMALADFAAAEGMEIASETNAPAEEKKATTQGGMGPGVSES
ncbi:MAG: hypothetical protein ACQKBY_08640, partial [Verrucomicrobiales bacterium]